MDTKNNLGKGTVGAVAVASAAMLAVGVAGGIATFTNLKASLGSASQAASVVLAGEAATALAAVIVVVLAMLRQAAPAIVRAALWLLPLTGAAVGASVADTGRETLVYAVSPLTMAVAAEGINLMVRRAIAYRDGRDVNADRRNAELAASINFHAQRAKSHPLKLVQKLSALRVWSLAGRMTVLDGQVDQLLAVSADRIAQGTDGTLAALLGNQGVPAVALDAPSRPALDAAVDAPADAAQDAPASIADDAPASTQDAQVSDVDAPADAATDAPQDAPADAAVKQYDRPSDAAVDAVLDEVADAAADGLADDAKPVDVVRFLMAADVTRDVITDVAVKLRPKLDRRTVRTAVSREFNKAAKQAAADAAA